MCENTYIYIYTLINSSIVFYSYIFVYIRCISCVSIIYLAANPTRPCPVSLGVRECEGRNGEIKLALGEG